MRAYLSTAGTVLLVAIASGISHADTADAQFTVASQHYANQDWRLAADEFDALRQDHPNYSRAGDAEFYAAESLVQLHEYDAAAKRFQDFLAQNDSHEFKARAIFRWGECAYLAERREEALHRLREFVRQYPEHELGKYALTYIGNSQQSLGDHRGAIRSYVDALKRFPQGPLADECLLQLANIAYQQKKYDEAAQLLNQLDQEFPDSELGPDIAYWQGMVHFDQSQYDPAAEDFLRVSRLDAEHARAAASLYFAAESLRRSGKLAQATAIFQALSAKPANDDWTDDALLGLMRLALQQRQYAELDALAVRLATEHPNSARRAEAQQLHGDSLLKRQLFDEALEVLGALSRDPGVTNQAKSVNLYLLAVAFLGADRPKEALQVLNQIRADSIDAGFNAQLQLARGTALTALGHYEPAITALKVATANDAAPSIRDRGQAELVDALLKSSQFAEAEQALRAWEHQGLAEKALLDRALQQLADFAFQREDYQAASRYYSRLLADSESEEALLRGLSGLAWCHFRMNNDEDAVVLFDRLLERAPDSGFAEEAEIARAHSLQRLNRSEEALAAYREIVKQPRQDDRWAAASLAAATLLESKDQLDEAAALLELLIRHQDLNQPIDQVWYQLAWVQQKRGDVRRAMSAFKRINQDHRSSDYWADATFRIAEAAFRVGRLEEARKHLQQIDRRSDAQSDPRIVPFALYLTARIAAEEQRWPAVTATLKRFILEFPSSQLIPSAQFWLAEAYYQQRDFGSALPHLQTVADSHSEDSVPWHAMALLRTAQIKAAERDWPEVRQLIASLSSRFPDFDRSYEVKYLDGRQYAAAGKFEQAREAFESTIDDPHGRFTETAAKAQWMIGESHLHQKNFQAALRAYRKVEMVYDYPQWQAAALLQAGKCCERLGQFEDARKLYRRMTDELPTTSFHTEASERLANLSDAQTENFDAP